MKWYNKTIVNADIFVYLKTSAVGTHERNIALRDELWSAKLIHFAVFL